MPTLDTMPAEMRLRIYDFVLQPLLELPEHDNNYVLPSERTYRSLLLAGSHQNYLELEQYFHMSCSPRIALFYSFLDSAKIPSLLDAATRAPELNHLRDLTLSIRSPIWPPDAAQPEWRRMIARIPTHAARPHRHPFAGRKASHIWLTQTWLNPTSWAVYAEWQGRRLQRAPRVK